MERTSADYAFGSIRQSVHSLHQRLAHAQAELRALTPSRGGGQRQLTDETAVDAVLERYAVNGLLTVNLQRETESRMVRAYGDEPARKGERHRYQVEVKGNRTRLRKLEPSLGWRVYVRNASARKLSLGQVILA